MNKTYKKRKYNTGVQKIYNDTPDYSKVDARKAKTTANDTLVSGTFDGVGQSLMPFNPVAGTSLTVGNKVGQIGQSVIGDNTAGRTFNYGAKGAGAGLAVASSLGPMGMALAPAAVAGGAVLGAGYGLLTGNANDAKDKREKRKAERAVALVNANKKFSESSSTDAQSFLAKKGKYKVKGRVIETEGREPIFSPKKKDGTRDLLYFNPNDPTHAEGGVKAVVKPKRSYKKGVNELKQEDPILKGAQFPYRIADKTKRNLQIKNLYLDFLDRDKTAGDHYFKRFHNFYGSDRINRPLENYYGFDYTDINDDSLKTWRMQHKKQLKYKKGTNKLEGDLISKVIMNRNKDKDFVKRTQATNMFKTFEDFDTKATHKMAYGEDDKGQSYMFPTILNNNNEAIKVPNQYAEYISNEGYKKATGMKYKCGSKNMKYKCGTSKMKYGDGSKKLKYKSSITDDRDKTPIEKLNTKTPILNNNNTPPPERVVKPVIDKLSIRQSNINVPEINKNINLKKTPEFIGPSQEINIDPREKEGIEFLKGKTPTLKIENKINKPILKKIPVAKSTNPIIKKPINTKEATFFTYGLYDHNNNGIDDFEEEYNKSSKKMKKFYGKTNLVKIDNRDPYRLTKLQQALSKTKKDSDVYFLDHAGSNLFGLPQNQFAKVVAQNTKHLSKGKSNCYMGSCYGGGHTDDKIINKINKQGKNFKTLYSTNNELWKGTDPSDKYTSPEDVFLPNKKDRYVVKNAMGNKYVKKYKKGTSSIKAVIPEGSSIVTAEGGKNIKAINAYKKGDFKTLDRIINSMPEDKSDKKRLGDEEIKFPSRFTSYTDPTEDKKINSEYKSTVKKREYIQKNIGNPKSKLKGASLDKDGNIVYENPVIKGKMEIAAKNNYNDIKPLENYKQPAAKTPVLNKVNVDPNFSTLGNIKSIDQNTGEDLKNKKSFDWSSIPSIAEIAARQSLLNKGVDKVPENYVKFGRYKYASQLPKNLQENMMATNTAKQSVKNTSGGNTGNYLSNVSNINTSRLKANNDAVITDTLARQDVLNKNVDVSNNEEQINVGLKNQFNDMKAQNLGAYKNQILAQGKSIDATIDTTKQNMEQKRINNILLKQLDTDNYTEDSEGNKYFKNPNTGKLEKITKEKKGAKNLKYKTIRK